MATEVNLINTDIVAKSITSTNAVTANRITGNGRLLKNVLVKPESLYLKTYLLPVSDVSLPFDVFTKYSIFPDTANLEINQEGFTSGFDGITVPETGLYIVGASARYNVPVRDPRSCVQVAPTINDEVQREHGSNGMVRGFGSHMNSSAHFTTVLSLYVGDVIGLQFRQVSYQPPWQQGDTQLLDTSHFFMYRVR